MRLSEICYLPLTLSPLSILVGTFVTLMISFELGILSYADVTRRLNTHTGMSLLFVSLNGS